MKFRLRSWLLAAAVVVVLLAAASPWLVEAYWRTRSSNPVRRGVEHARELGCFSCHGHLGAAGIADPAHEPGVPQWTGGVWMMYVKTDAEIRRLILDGSAARRGNAGPDDADDGDERADRGPAAGEHADHLHARIEMPAYRAVLGDAELDDLVAAFKVLSGMTAPPQGSAARRGRDLAQRWDCFDCHGAAGSGGLPNPGSFAGFVPGWYGADFEDLVRSREEFDAWIRHGSIERLDRNPIAAFFTRRQRIAMPAYADLTDDDLEDLWAYVGWLAETGGGHEAAAAAW